MWSDHSDKPFCDHRHCVTIVDYVYKFDYETELKAGVSVSIPLVIQAWRQA